MSIEDLLPLNEALQLEKSKFNKIVKDLLPYTSYCGSMFIPEKMEDWCSYLQCDGSKCKSPLILQNLDKPITHAADLNFCTKNISQDAILNYNGSCFDHFFCIPDWASKDHHYLLGIFGIALGTLSLVFSLIYLIGFHREFGKKKTKTIMLMAQSACDIIFILSTMVCYLSIFTNYSNLADQLKLYSSFNIYLILYLLPFGSLFESMSIWILILLIFDRYNYLNHGTHSKNLLTKKMCSVILGSIFVALIAFTSLKPFMFQMESVPSFKKNYRLIYSKLGRNENYQNLLRFWLKMPLESLLPLTTIFIFISMVFHKLIFGSAETAKRNSSFIDFQEHRLTKSILFICCLLLSTKVPKMALHILKYEIGLEVDKEIKINLFCELFDQFYYAIKTCVLYQYMCPNFSHYFQNLLCFDTDYQNFGYLKDNKCSLEYDNDDEDKDLLFEESFKQSMLRKVKIDLETIV